MLYFKDDHLTTLRTIQWLKVKRLPAKWLHKSIELLDRKVIAEALFLLWNYSLLNRQYFLCKYFPTNISRERRQKKFLPLSTRSTTFYNKQVLMIGLFFLPSGTGTNFFFFSCSNIMSRNVTSTLSLNWWSGHAATDPQMWLHQESGVLNDTFFFLNKECQLSTKHSVCGLWAGLSFFTRLLCLAIAPEPCLVEAPPSLLSDSVFVSRGRWEVSQTAQWSWRSHSEIWQHCTENWHAKILPRVVKKALPSQSIKQIFG